MTSIVEVALRVRLEEAERERDEALKQARYAWERHAEKDRAYGDALRERDEARAKAAAYERDWYEAKSEFGTAAAKLRESVRTLEAALTLETRVSLDYQSQRDEVRADVEEARAALGAAWLTGGVSLAEGIRCKTAALEKLR